MRKDKVPFITFEGGEGSGKSTQIQILYQRLLEIGVDVLTLREPGGTKGAEEIRSLLLNGDNGRWSATSEALLMSAARADLVTKRIIPQLERGTWVLCDRFADSTIAYQGYGHELGYEAIETLNKFTVGKLEPDLTFIFQLNPELGLERAHQRGKGRDRYEAFDLSFHKRVAKGYADILEKNPERCVSINALLDIDFISKIIYENVLKKFGAFF